MSFKSEMLQYRKTQKRNQIQAICPYCGNSQLESFEKPNPEYRRETVCNHCKKEFIIHIEK